MATIKFELKDCNGVDTDIGDEIEVTFPEIDIIDWSDDTDGFYRPGYKARAIVLCPPSKGLMLRIIEILEVSPIEDDMSFDIYGPGDRCNFRRTVWHWRNLTKAKEAPNV